MLTAIEQIQLKIARSKTHLAELQAQVQAFFGGRPYQVAFRRDPQTKRLIYFLYQADEVPAVIAVIAGEVVQHLRSALDHLAYRLVVVGTGGAAPMGHVYFPIADSLEKYQKNKKSQLSGVTAGAMNVVDAVRPYRGGTNSLWSLHKLNNIDKHRLLLMVGSAFRSLDIGAIMLQYLNKALPEGAQGKGITFPPVFLRPADRMFPLKVGDQLFIDGPDAEPNDKMEFKFEIALQEPEAEMLNGAPLMETLSEFVTVVENTVVQLAHLL